MDSNTQNISQDLLNVWQEKLTELENNLAIQAEEIIQKLEAKSAKLDERAAELDLQQHYIEDCKNKLQILQDFEKKLRLMQKSCEERDAALKISAEKLEQDYQRRIELLEKDFSEKNSRVDEKSRALEKKATDLIQRETAVLEKETALEESLSQKRSALQNEILMQRQNRIDELSDFLDAERQKYTDRLTKNFQNAEQRYAEESLKALQTLKENLDTETKKSLDNLQKLENQRLQELQAREDEVAKKEVEQAQLDTDLKRLQRRLAALEENLNEREENLDELVEERYAEKFRELNDKINAKDFSYTQLLESFHRLQLDAEKLKVIRDTFGDMPFDVMNKTIDDLQSENKRLKEKINALPSERTGEELQAKIAETASLQIEVENLRNENLSLRDGASKSDELESQLRRQTNKLVNLQFELEESIKTQEFLQNQLNRLRTDEGRLIERDERIKSIEVELPDVKAPISAETTAPVADEIEWLENIGKNCYNYGFKFPRRILYAFHTALKIADWSTITVLAGVSGTGKSALPHLYSAFGGLNFISVSVQPNWDSQESMLGFFNSIDNKFDAQPLLRFLARCSSDKDGMDKSLNIVLLDEMNLAHVEHYFAEFLSKLELRRDSDSDKNLSVDINIGAGIEPYHLKLTRNILWTGTMNQDETTKSLSDKVLDRGLIINFPRPKNLISRTKLQKLENLDYRLDFRTWNEQWVKNELDFGTTQKTLLEHYRQMIQQINNYLANVGRALGHRVWQSIEFYTMNYPTVIKALAESGGEITDDLRREVKIAVEDQLVQKVMPKLRGIETRGIGNEECLQKIRALLLDEEFNLDEDFAIAEKLGYGQFIWNSAEYIDDDDIVGAPEIDFVAGNTDD